MSVGIYLAKAIAHNRSQEGLRDLWFERGDMAQLLLLPTRLPVRLRLFLRVRPAGPDLRPAARARPATPPRDGVQLRARGGSVQPASQRQPRLDAAAYLRRHGADLQSAEQLLRGFIGPELDGFNSDLYRELDALTRSWHPDRRRDLLGKDHPDYRPACLKACAAILDEEEHALTHISETVRALRAELAA